MKRKEKRSNTTQLQEKKGMKKSKRIRRYLLIYVCRSLIYE